MVAQTVAALTVVQEWARRVNNRLAVVDLDAQPAVRGAACRQERIREMLTGVKRKTTGAIVQVTVDDVHPGINQRVRDVPNSR